MTKQLDNTTMWNEAAKAGFFLGGLSVVCLLGKEWATVSGIAFLQQAAMVILWVVEFFGCILIMKKMMLDLRDRYEDVRMADTYKLGRRAALLSGLLLASAQALLIMQMPADTMNTMLDSLTGTMNLSSQDKETVDGMMDKLPVVTFFCQWLYCYFYGTILASILSRYIFVKRLFTGSFTDDKSDQKPDEQ